MFVLYVRFGHTCEHTHMYTRTHNRDSLEGATQAGVVTCGGPQPFML